MIRVLSFLLGVAALCVAIPSFGDSALPHTSPVADRLVVDKSDRKLTLLKDGQVLRSFDVSLGLSPTGHKRQEGDFKTPEGVYSLESKNPKSDFFLSIKISYPDQRDRQAASRRGVQPGGQIMIHGQPNEPKHPVESYRGRDWTDGCIAVANGDMVDIWLMTEVGTEIEIRP